VLRKGLFYVLLGVATVALSRLLAAWRVWRAAPTPAGGVWVVLFGVIVLGAVLALGFLLYQVDRAAGRVRRRVALYEWVIQSWQPGPAAASQRSSAGGDRRG
jgi:hypothetical protein